MLTTNGKNQLLDANDITHLALHSDYPGDTFLNECTGGSPAYARKAVTWASAASGALDQSGSVTFDVTGTAAWVSGATAVSGGSQRALWPLEGESKEYAVDTANDLIQAPSHGYVASQAIVFYGDNAPGGLTKGTVYYVRYIDADSFEVSTTAGGAKINLTSIPTGSCVVSKITVSTGGQRTLAITDASLHLNH